MYRVLIVDDDKLIVDDLIDLLDWQKLDCGTPERASDGSQALKLLQRGDYDIVLTDISMPVMDGVELIRHAREDHCMAVFLVISNYDDFAYVKEAMKLGAAEYLLKYEITAESLSEQIQYAKRCLRTKKETLTSVSQEAVRQRLLQELYDGNKKWQDLVMEAGFPKGQGTAVPVLLWVFREYQTGDSKEKIRSILADVCQDENLNGGYFKEVAPGMILLLLFIRNPSYLFATNLVAVLLKRLFACVREEGAAVGARVLRFCHTLSEVSGALSAEKERQETMFYLQPFAISTGEARTPGQSYRLEEAEWIRAFHGEDPEQLDRLFGYLAYHLVPVEEAKRFLTELLSAVSLQSAPVLADIWNARNAYDIKKSVEVFLKTQREFRMSEAGRMEIRNVLQYISEHYAEKITLEELASYAGLSPNYLCRIFKAEMGVSYSEYLNKVRIERAKELLGSTGLRTNEVALKVGFLDYRYFCRVFKNLTGCTCSEYKREKMYR